MERRNAEIYGKGSDIPLDLLSLFDLVNVYYMESGISYFKEVQKWLHSEEVAHLDSERVLL